MPTIGIYDVKEFEQSYYHRALKNYTIHLYEESFPENPKQHDIISVFTGHDITAELLKKHPRIKMIATRSTGYDHIDLAACKKRRVIVSNVPRYGENTVAEHAFALLLAISRKVLPAVQRTRMGSFSREGLTGFDLKGKTAGVVGTGRIGQHFIRMAKGFGMEVLAQDPYPNHDAATQLGFTYTSMPTLLAKADIISLHAPLTKKTRHLIGGKEISRMKKGSIIINTSRGGLINTKALLKGLMSGRIAGAGLDVLEEEDFIQEEAELLWAHDTKRIKLALQNHVLLHMDNVLITPHNAFNSQEAVMRIMKTTVENIKAFSVGKPQNTVHA
ncbi:hypothetical protein AUJ68_00630 [Candidatus Woesearchaeota archaeon CG1_02_57_44]|nr:MAG: hypothetical protein AUJ68_00630 [Candidatus Woesearchaeota archaeon CG1_02_57_44]